MGCATTPEECEMDTGDIVGLLLENGLYLVAVILVTAAALSLSRRGTSKLMDGWKDYARQHQFNLTSETATYNYGAGIGEQEFTSPGLAGRVDGRAVRVQARVITKPRGREHHGYLFSGQVLLPHEHPTTVMLHLRKLDRETMRSLPPRIKTGDAAWDRYFKTHRATPLDATTLTPQARDALAYFKQAFHTASLHIDETRLLFDGRPKRQRLEPAHAHELIRHLAALSHWLDPTPLAGPAQSG
jgi:hypothetical protein